MSTEHNHSNPFLTAPNVGETGSIRIDSLFEFIAKVQQTSANFTTGVGTPNDPSTHETAILDTYYYSAQEIEALCGICQELRTTVASRADDMIDNWFVWKPTNLNNELQELVNKKLEKVLKPVYYETQYKADFYGGACTGRLHDDGSPLEAPLNIEMVTPANPVAYSVALSKFYIRPIGYLPENRYPTYYQLNYINQEQTSTQLNSATGEIQDLDSPPMHVAKVHRSRMFRCNGLRVGEAQFQNNGGWDRSVVIDAASRYQDYEGMIKSVRAAMRTFEILINYIQDFSKKIKHKEAEERMTSLAQAELYAQSILGMTFGDLNKQKFEVLNREFKGVAEILNLFKQRADESTGVSSWKLSRKLPESFLGSTGLQMRTREAKDIATMTKRLWGRALLTDVELVLRSNGFVMDPSEWTLEFSKGVWLTEEEKAAIYAEYAKGDRINIQSRIITETEARNRHGQENVGALLLNDEDYEKKMMGDPSEAKATEVAKEDRQTQQIKTKNLVVTVTHNVGAKLNGTRLSATRGVSEKHFDSNGNPLQILVGSNLDSPEMYLVEVANPLTEDFQEEVLVIKAGSIEDAGRVYATNIKSPQNNIRHINAATLKRMEDPAHRTIKPVGDGLSIEELESV